MDEFYPRIPLDPISSEVPTELDPGMEGYQRPAGETLRRADSSIIGSFVPPFAILSAMALCLYVTNTGWLFFRPLWLDEFHTLLVAKDPGIAHSLALLRKGADFNPPALYLLLKVYTTITGPITELSLRAFAFVSVYVGLLGVYYLLRMSFKPPVALAGTLATWAHPLLLHHAFDGRFYGPWFAALAWLCVFLNKLKPGQHRIRISAMTAVLSAFVCSVHYYGIISLVIVGTCHLVFSARWPGRLFQSMTSMATGPVALAVCIPLFYPGQRAAISVPTWISPLDVYQARAFLGTLFPSMLFAVPSILVSVDTLLRQRLTQTLPILFDQTSLGPLAGAMGLSLMPAAIMGISCLVQPTAIARYAIPTVLCVGPVVASLLERTRRGVTELASIGLLATAAMNLSVESESNYDSVDAINAIKAIRDQERGRTAFFILSEQREMVYQCWRYARGLRGRIRMIDRVDDHHESKSRNFHKLEHDVAVRLHELFETPGITTLSDLAGVGTIYILAPKSRVSLIADKLKGFRRRVLYENRVVALKLVAVSTGPTLNDPVSGPEIRQDFIKSGRP